LIQYFICIIFISNYLDHYFKSCVYGLYVGNLRADRDFRHDRDGRGFDRQRDDRNMFRDRGRQRSRSPEYRGPPMRTQRGGLARSGFGNGGPRGYDPSGLGGGARGGENDLSLLMNLSQMLS